MKRAYFVAVLGSVVGSLLALAACSEDNGTSTPSPAKDSGVGADASKTDSGTGTDGGGAGDTGGTTTETGGLKCPETLKSGSIESFRDPASATKAIVNDGIKLTGVVATSIKYRTRNPKKAGDSCQFAVFVADANATFKPYSGIQVISYGDNAVATDGGGVTCPTGTDFIPDDIKPGDKLDLTGTYTEFGPSASACGSATPPVPPPIPDKQPQVFKVCALTKTGDGALPAPADVTPAQLETRPADAGVAGGAENLKWVGGLVRIKDVEADACATGATCTGALSFGAFKVKGSTLEVTNTIYYRGAATAPTVAVGDKFSSVTGVMLLDFCTWSLAPSKCADMVWSGGTGKCPGGGDAAP
jgi:hypothetical protein